jgi:hypothetical protein
LGDDATFVVVPCTPPLDCVVPATLVLPVVLLLVVDVFAVVLDDTFAFDDTFVLLDELTFELVFVDELTFEFELAFAFTLPFAWTDVLTAADAPHAAVPVLSAWTSGLCCAPGHETLCGWLLPGPVMVAVPVSPFDAATCAAVWPLPYFLDESDFAEAWTVAAAVPPVPV